MPRTLRFIRLLLVGALAACGSRTPVEESPCIGSGPICVVPSTGCDAPTTVNPSCDAEAHVWACPTGSRVYARQAAPAPACLPFHGGPVGLLGGSLARVPIDRGRCLWVADDVMSAAGAEIHNAGFVVDPSLAFGACPEANGFPSGSLQPVVRIAGGDDPSLLVQIDGGFAVGGRTSVFYRLFRRDPSAVFGAVELGGGVGAWDPGAQQIVVGGPDALGRAAGSDMGDASLVVGGVPYVWGCHGRGGFLVDRCYLGRLVMGGALELFAAGGSWVPLSDASEAVAMFDAGPWISSVVPAGAGTSAPGFVHVYVSGFGSVLDTHTSSAVQGPWSSGPSLAACDLPPGDPHAFCAGPVVHTELMDPTRPGELVISYQVGSTAPRPAPLLGTLADAYWSRLVWVTQP